MTKYKKNYWVYPDKAITHCVHGAAGLSQPLLVKKAVIPVVFSLRSSGRVSVHSSGVWG